MSVSVIDCRSASGMIFPPGIVDVSSIDKCCKLHATHVG